MSKQLLWLLETFLKETKEHQFLREFLAFVLSTVMLQISRFAVNLVAARWLGPPNYGIWNSFVLVLTYAPVLTLGTINAMNRDVPLLAGQRNHVAVSQVTGVTFFVSAVSGILAGLAVLMVGISQGKSIWGRLIFWGSILIPANQIYIYLQTWLRSNMRFRAISCQQLINALIYPIIILPTTFIRGLEGYIWGQVLIICSINAFTIIAFKAPLKMKFNVEIFCRLVKIGLPILTAGILYSLLITIDRWIILTYLGTEALGYYSPAIMVSSMVELLPMVIAQQIYPRMAYRFGETGDVGALKSLIIKQVVWSTTIVMPVLVIAYLGLPEFVERLLPNYQPGVKPACIVLWGLACLSLSGGIGNFLNTIGKQNYYLMVQFIAVILNFLIGVLLVRLGMGLIGVASGFSLSLFIYTIMLVAVGWWIYKTQTADCYHSRLN